MYLMLLFTLLFSIYAWVQSFDMFCRILSLFTQHLTLNGCILTSLTDTHVLLRCGARKEQKIGSSTDHGQTVVPPRTLVSGKLLPLRLSSAVQMRSIEVFYKQPRSSSIERQAITQKSHRLVVLALVFFLYSNFVVTLRISSLILVLARNLQCMCLVCEAV